MTTNIKVSGNILSELSEKIPTNIIALNELMKNAYDAGANFVCITINQETNQLIISDDGEGMDESDISTLFHISESKKAYGKKNKYGRITQGSKGLGFLSVFKFGSKVTWKTHKQKGLQFSVDFQDILSYEDISTYEVQIADAKDILKGTQIFISLSEYSMKTLIAYLSEEKNRQKILHSFDDSSFSIKLNINGDIEENAGKQEIRYVLKERQLYRVKYSSLNERLEFYVNDCLALTKEFKGNDKRYTIDLDIIIFQLVQYDKRKINALFYNPQDDLTPLIYVNSNLFNNFSIFDPNAMRNIKSSLVLGQMIGYICITSEDAMLNFNSDRTQFLQNELTDNIITFVDAINKNIQETGSVYKNHLLTFDILKKNSLPHTYRGASEDEFRSNIVEDFKFKDNVEIVISENFVTYKLFNKEISAIIEEKASAIPAIIKINKANNRIPIVSSQILLDSFIISVTNSRGMAVDKKDVKILIDGVLSTTRILESILDERKVNLRFEYDDAETGKAIESIELNFYQPKAEVTAATTKDKLLIIDAKESYQITFNNSIQKLVLELNALNVTKNLEVIACSLRALFDISTYCIRQVSHYVSFYKTNETLEDRVKQTVKYIASDKKRKEKIAINTGMGYHNLDNRLQSPDDYFVAVKKAHLGAHMSTINITELEIRELAHKASLFIVIANEMISNHI